MEFLKCDAEGCDHREETDRITSDMIGKACPVCGANLLTPEDFAFYEKIMRPGMVMLEALGLSKPADASTPPEQRLSVNAHNGELRIKLPSATTTSTVEGQ